MGRYANVQKMQGHPMTPPNQDWFIELLPWELDVPSAIATCAMYELHNKPIILKNGAEVYPQGWLRFLGYV